MGNPAPILASVFCQLQIMVAAFVTQAICLFLTNRNCLTRNRFFYFRFGPYFVEPVIAGLDPKTKIPYIASMDLIGCPMVTDDFVVSGTCSEQMYGMCESLWEPDLGPDDLFETISQALMNAFDRDAVSGWGGVVYIIEKDKITKKMLKTRQD